MNHPSSLKHEEEKEQSLELMHLIRHQDLVSFKFYEYFFSSTLAITYGQADDFFSWKSLKILLSFETKQEEERP